MEVTTLSVQFPFPAYKYKFLKEISSLSQEMWTKQKKKKKEFLELNLPYHDLFHFPHHFSLSFFLAFLLCLFRHKKFQARNRIWAVAVGLCHSHSKAGSLTHWARPGIEPESSWTPIGFVTAEPQQELPPPPFPISSLSSTFPKGSQETGPRERKDAMGEQGMVQVSLSFIRDLSTRMMACDVMINRVCFFST